MGWSRDCQSMSAVDTKARFLAGESLPDGLLPEVISRSWQRCVDRRVSIQRQARAAPVVSSRALAGLREQSRRLIAHSETVMEQLYEQISGTSSVVVLTDLAGVILHSVGDPDFVEKAQQVALQPGGIWTEEANGTNAIGTALIEQIPVTVHNSEHFIASNQFLTCSAVPIFDPRGSMLGALDVSSESDAYQRHTMALVRMSAQIIENQFFAHECNDGILIHFHLRPEFIGTLYEGIAGFSLDGRFVSGNRAALIQLGLTRFDVKNHTIGSIFDVTIDNVVEQVRRLPQPVFRLRLRSGVEVYGRVKFGASVSPITLLPTRQPDATRRVGMREVPSGSLSELNLGDPSMEIAIRKANKIINHDIPLMIEGESGTGKEMFARAFHADGPRSKGPFIALNCAAIPEGLIESELFGYCDGAFTGARRSGSLGKMQQANGGTLFLDEIGDMQPSLQARLLRVLQDRTVTPLGGAKSLPVDIKIICATNRRLREEVTAGRFREDLYYRINGLLVTLPPLRARADRLALAVSLLGEYAQEGEDVGFSAEVLELFSRHSWPGNIRQLANIIRTSLVMRDGDTDISVEHLPEDFLDQMDEHSVAVDIRDVPLTNSGSSRLEEMEIEAIREALRECNGNVSAAAKKLGISRSTLYRKSKGAIKSLVY